MSQAANEGQQGNPDAKKNPENEQEDEYDDNQDDNGMINIHLLFYH